jgi:hypothetical protein
MAIVHKVIVLNTPFRLFGYSFVQWVVLLFTALISCWAWFSCPPVKINGLPLGLFAFLAIFCTGIVFVHASLIKPWQWWLNRVLYAAQLLPTKIFPQPQPIKRYIEDNSKQTNKPVNSDSKLNKPFKKDKWNYN